MAYQRRHQSVFGIFETEASAKEAVDRLKHSKFKTEDISVLTPSKLGGFNFTFEKTSRAPEGALIGMISGAMLGYCLGWLSGIGISSGSSSSHD